MRRPQRGFTLLEIMVVLIIVGILVSFSVLQLGDKQDEQLRQEARRLQTLISLAREEAILEAREYAIGFWRGGYSFYELNEDEDHWSSVSADPDLRPREIPEFIDLALELEGQLVIMELKPPEKPQVFLLSSGEMTPFVLQLSLPERDDSSTEISFDQLGRINHEAQPS